MSYKRGVTPSRRGMKSNKGTKNNKNESRRSNSRSRINESEKLSKPLKSIMKNSVSNSKSELSRNRNKTSNNNRKFVRNIKFTDRNEIYMVDDVVSTQDEDVIDSYWMTDHDYDQTLLESTEILELIEWNEKHERFTILPDDTMVLNKSVSICVRGLKDMTTNLVNDRELLRRNLFMAVFRLQKKQQKLKDQQLQKQKKKIERRRCPRLDKNQQQHCYDMDVEDKEAMRQLCKNYTKKSVRVARLLGISDEVNAAA